jgi:hypothetical protein
MAADFPKGAMLDFTNRPLAHAQEHGDLLLSQWASWRVARRTADPPSRPPGRVTHPGSLLTCFGLPFSCHEQRLSAVGQTGTFPLLPAAWAGEYRLPDSASLGSMNAGFDQPGFSHGFSGEDFDDLLGGSAEARLRASWHSARHGSGQQKFNQLRRGHALTTQDPSQKHERRKRRAWTFLTPTFAHAA